MANLGRSVPNAHAAFGGGIGHSDSRKLEAILARHLDAGVITLLAVLVLTESVEAFETHAESFDGQPDQIAGDVFRTLECVPRQRVGQFASGLAEREVRSPMLGPPLFVGDEPADAGNGPESVERVKGRI